MTKKTFLWWQKAIYVTLKCDLRFYTWKINKIGHGVVATIFVIRASNLQPCWTHGHRQSFYRESLAHIDYCFRARKMIGHVSFVSFKCSMYNDVSMLQQLCKSIHATANSSNCLLLSKQLLLFAIAWQSTHCMWWSTRSQWRLFSLVFRQICDRGHLVTEGGH